MFAFWGSRALSLWRVFSTESRHVPEPGHICQGPLRNHPKPQTFSVTVPISLRRRGNLPIGGFTSGNSITIGLSGFSFTFAMRPRPITFEYKFSKFLLASFVSYLSSTRTSAVATPYEVGSYSQFRILSPSHEQLLLMRRVKCKQGTKTKNPFREANKGAVQAAYQRDGWKDKGHSTWPMVAPCGTL